MDTLLIGLCVSQSMLLIYCAYILWRKVGELERQLDIIITQEAILHRYERAVSLMAIGVPVDLATLEPYKDPPPLH